jgi:hypothetical protein
MALHHPDTPADRAAWARLWDIVRTPWERTAELAEFLGVGRTTIVEWSPGGRHEGAGPWCLIRLALRRTARKYPAAVPVLVARLAEELLDVRGRWVPEDAEPVGPYADESADVTVAHGELTAAIRRGDRVAVLAAARRLVEEAEEAARAAVGQA